MTDCCSVITFTIVPLVGGNPVALRRSGAGISGTSRRAQPSPKPPPARRRHGLSTLGRTLDPPPVSTDDLLRDVKAQSQALRALAARRLAREGLEQGPQPLARDW